MPAIYLLGRRMTFASDDGALSYLCCALVRLLVLVPSVVLFFPSLRGPFECTSDSILYTCYAHSIAAFALCVADCAGFVVALQGTVFSPRPFMGYILFFQLVSVVVLAPLGAVVTRFVLAQGMCAPAPTIPPSKAYSPEDARWFRAYAAGVITSLALAGIEIVVWCIAFLRSSSRITSAVDSHAAAVASWSKVFMRLLGPLAAAGQEELELHESRLVEFLDRAFGIDTDDLVVSDVLYGLYLLRVVDRAFARQNRRIVGGFGRANLRSSSAEPVTRSLQSRAAAYAVQSDASPAGEVEVVEPTAGNAAVTSTDTVSDVPALLTPASSISDVVIASAVGPAPSGPPETERLESRGPTAESVDCRPLDSALPADAAIVRKIQLYSASFISVYGWPLYVFSNPCSGFAKLLCCTCEVDTSQGPPFMSCALPCCKSSPNDADAATDAERLEGDCFGMSRKAFVRYSKAPLSDVLHFQLDGDLHRTAFLLYLHRQARSVVLVCRGTRSVADVITDLDARPASVYVSTTQGVTVIVGIPMASLLHDRANEARSAADAPLEGTLGQTTDHREYVHSGMLSAGVNIILALRRAGKLQEAYANWDWTGRHASLDFVVVGHSLGAGTAALIAALLRGGAWDWLPHGLSSCASRRRRVNQLPSSPGSPPPAIGTPSTNMTLATSLFAATCVAYSPPGQTFSKLLAEGARSYVTSVVIGRDWAPRFSVSSLGRLRLRLQRALRVAKRSKGLIQAIAPIASLWCVPEKFWQPNFLLSDTPDAAGAGAEASDSSVQGDSYTSFEAYHDVAIRTSDVESTSAAFDMPLQPPGCIIHITRDVLATRHCRSQITNAATLEWGLSEVSAKTFSEIEVSISGLRDHLPDVVHDAIEKAAQYFQAQRS